MRRLLVALLVATAAAPAVAADRALLVGCTEYPHLPKARHLFGPVNDTALLRETLVTHLGVPAANVLVLAGWKDGGESNPTRANILEALGALARTARPGDRVLVLMAGHGSRQPDDSGDEPDGLDEIFLPADVRAWNGKEGTVENAITDDEISVRIRRIRDRGATVCLLMDCCHAGTMARGLDDSSRSRRVDPRELGIPDAGSRPGAASRSAIPDLAGVAALYASPSWRPTEEQMLPRSGEHRRWHGLFTYMVCAALRRTRGELSFRELHAHVVAAYQALPHRGAVPVAEGDLDLLVRGGRTDRPPLWVRRRGKTVVLDAGRLTGVVAGVRLAVRQPGEDEPLGEAVVVEAGVTQSICRTVGFELPEGSVFPVGILSSPVFDSRLRVLVTEPDGGIPAAVAKALTATATRVVRTEDATRADWELRVEAGGRSTLRPARGGGASVFEVPPGRLERTLRQIHRSEALGRFGASGLADDLPSSLTVTMRRLVKDGTAPIEPGAVLSPGDRFEVRLRNETGNPWDVTLLVLDAAHGVTELFPRFESPRLSREVGTERTLGPFEITDDTQGLEHLLVIAVPGEDDRPTTLGWLEADPLEIVVRAPETGEAARLLRALAFEGTSRGLVARTGHVAAGLLTWRTEWEALGPPDSFPSSPVTCGKPAATGEAPAPDAWWIGPRVGLAASRVGGPLDLLLAGGEKPERILIDVDGDSRPDPARLAEIVATRAFDAEIAFHFGPDRRTVWLDTDNDGRFDLVVIDRDGDPEADERRVLGEDGWEIDRESSGPWLRCADLRFPGGAKAARRKVAILKRP